MAVDKLRFNLGNINYDVPTKEYVDNYITSNNNSNNSNVVYNDTPIGTIISYMGTSAPRDYLICDGQTYNISDYQALADFINTQFGSYNKFGGNGTTTFAVPDLRGEFLRGSGTNSHNNQGNGAAVGIHQNATEHLTEPFRLESSNTYAQVFGEEGWNDNENVDSYKITRKYANLQMSRGLTEHTSDLRSKFTSRPTNTSVLYCIKYTTSILSTPENDYSTTEKIIGTWIDGKPLYQKTIVATAPDEENVLTELCLLPDNVNTTNIFDMKVTAHSPNSYACFTNYYYSTAEAITFWIRPNRKITCVIRSPSWLNSTLYITLQYTKTTD